MPNNFSKYKKRIGIIGAMDAEIEEYLKHLSGKKEITWQIFKFYLGKINGRNVVIVKSGVGKVFAAMICQKLIDEFNVGKIIFSGVAGALNEKLNILDIVVAKDLISHDMDATAMGFKRGEIPYSGLRFFDCSNELKKIALGAKIDDNKIIEGRILTGDQFFSNKDRKKNKYLTKELEGDAIEMEGAAVAQVCTVNNIPFLVIRSISDRANDKAAGDFTSFINLAAKNSFKIVEYILKNI
jgi:adenosylhomocysteine nucleosidase